MTTARLPVRMAIGSGQPIQIGTAEFNLDPAGDVILTKAEIADALRRVADSVVLGPAPEPEDAPADQPRAFRLMRDVDVTGVSVDGHVADGVQFPDGTVVIRWLGDYSSTVVWDDLAKAMHVHGHRGSTRVEWLDEDAAKALGEAYRERARLIAYLASLFPSELSYGDTNAPTWPVIYITTPAGQLSWHLSPDDLDLFEHVAWHPSGGANLWDGHTTEEKYRRLASLIPAGVGPTPADERKEAAQ